MPGARHPHAASGAAAGRDGSQAVLLGRRDDRAFDRAAAHARREAHLGVQHRIHPARRLHEDLLDDGLALRPQLLERDVRLGDGRRARHVVVVGVATRAVVAVAGAGVLDGRTHRGDPRPVGADFRRRAGETRLRSRARRRRTVRDEDEDENPPPKPEHAARCSHVGTYYRRRCAPPVPSFRSSTGQTAQQVPLAQPATSSVRTVKRSSVDGPKLVVSATSAASRPRAISTRPMRGTLLRGSKVYQASPR